MKKITTLEIIVETDEIFIARKSGEQLRGWCEKCGKEVPLIPQALPPHEEQDEEVKR